MSYYKSIKLLGMEAIARLFMLIVTPFVTFVLHVLTCGVFAWFIGLFFGDGILEILSSLGIEGFSMWQIGIFMGFFSGFFKRMITFSDNRKAKVNSVSGNTEVNENQTGNVIINIGTSNKK
jgi:hypothetical protein